MTLLNDLRIKLRHWTSAVKSRDLYTCQRCGSLRDLHAHHISREESKLFNLGNGITLCAKCHRQVHKYGNLVFPTSLLRSVIKEQFLPVIKKLQQIPLQLDVCVSCNEERRISYPDLGLCAFCGPRYLARKRYSISR